MRERTREISHTELEEVRGQLQSGLKEMLRFETQLREIDKETLCLFLTLMVDRDSYPRVLELLRTLEPADGRDGIGF